MLSFLCFQVLPAKQVLRIHPPESLNDLISLIRSTDLFYFCSEIYFFFVTLYFAIKMYSISSPMSMAKVSNNFFYYSGSFKLLFSFCQFVFQFTELVFQSSFIYFFVFIYVHIFSGSLFSLSEVADSAHTNIFQEAGSIVLLMNRGSQMIQFRLFHSAILSNKSGNPASSQRFPKRFRNLISCFCIF